MKKSQKVCYSNIYLTAQCFFIFELYIQSQIAFRKLLFLQRHLGLKFDNKTSKKGHVHMYTARRMRIADV
jgi:hypothetical protein